MKLKPLLCSLGLFLWWGQPPLHAWQSEANQKYVVELRAKADSGSADAENELGLCLLNGERGVTPDKAEGVKWLRKAAAQNFAEAQYNLGDCYAGGQGVAKDEAEAVKWFPQSRRPE